MPGTARRRTLNPRLARRDRTYTVDEVVALFGVHANTVRNWLGHGLKTIDDRRPILVHGSDLISFLKRKRTTRKRRCLANEFNCFKCREPREPRVGSIEVIRQANGIRRLMGHCVLCGTRMFRAAPAESTGCSGTISTCGTAPAEHIAACTGPAADCDRNGEEELP